MPETYEVKPGEDLVHIAHAKGFNNLDTLLEANEALWTEDRVRGEVHAGDTLQVPTREELTPIQATCETGRRHTFVCKTLKMEVRVLPLDEEGQPYRNAPYTLEVHLGQEGVEDPIIEGETDEDGVVEEWVPVAKRATLRLLVVRDEEEDEDEDDLEDSDEEASERDPVEGMSEEEKEESDGSGGENAMSDVDDAHEEPSSRSRRSDDEDFTMEDDAEDDVERDELVILELRLGELAPVDTIPGMKDRLHNLGYPCEEMEEARWDETSGRSLLAFMAEQGAPRNTFPDDESFLARARQLLRREHDGLE
ncbi:hypothetical protein HPC49_46515 [Pyxidicoccus fallax]|uniref:Uncharacterized protein n=1 Tax=Pyxidicoccus fallax TaxID=394095 RepID=A0A848LYD4_9BACT|nr:hypothetical protein [Pyxidicoccus fallax]NMO22542.1 hypothetical protein [Pyxidicoccus fallax]NPC85631.1 hypothetical protein [Pyxidicoccus fallax]